MAEDGKRPRPAPELPPPPRLVQYGLPPARHQNSREGGGAVEQFPLREDHRLEVERRQHLAHSIQLLQQKAAQQQQQARLAGARTCVPLPPAGGALLEQRTVSSVTRAAGHRAPAVSGFVNHTTVPASQVRQTGSQMQVPSGRQKPAAAAPLRKSSGGGHKVPPTDRPAQSANPAVVPPADGPVKAAPAPQTTLSAGGTAQSNNSTGQIRNGASHTDSPAGQTDGSAPHLGRPPGAPASQATGQTSSPVSQTADQTGGPASQATGHINSPSSQVTDQTCGPASQVTGPSGGPASQVTGPSGGPASQVTGPPVIPGSEPNGPPVIPAFEPTGPPSAPASQPTGPLIASAASPTKRASPAAEKTEPAAKRSRSDAPAATSSPAPAPAPIPTPAPSAAAAISPTHKGKKAWLSRLANAEEPVDGAAAGGGVGEEPANTAPAPAETEESPPAEETKPNGDEPAADAEEREAMDEGSSGEGEAATNGAQQNGVLAPRAAAAATKAAAAAKRGPGRSRRKTPANPAAAKRPSVMALKKSGESFAQTNFCCQIAAKLPRCRECRAVPMQRHNKPTSIYCRFTAFRRVRYTRTGQLTVTGFCDPNSDTSGESDRLWRAGLDGRPTMEPEIAKFLLAHVGNQYCDLVCDEEAARRCHMAEDQTVAWKRVVQGCREMCDVCETTLFNVHWVCSRCGFAVCVDCYRSRRDGTAKNWGEPVAERDQFRWLLCGVKPHEQDRLILTQIVAGDALTALNRQVHEARQLAGLPLTCQCEEARRLQQQQEQGGEGVKKEPGDDGGTDGSVVKAEHGQVGGGDVKKEEDMKREGGGSVKTEGDGGDAAQTQGKQAGSPLAFLADIALSKIVSDDSDSDSDDEGGGGSLTLRRLLVPGTQAAENKPKPVKKERQERPKRGGWSMEDSLDEVLDKVSARCGAPPPSSHAATGPAALRHFVRRCASKRGLRERLPIRIMTLGESTRLYPAVRHSWLCDGKLLRLHDSAAPDSVRLFRDQWKRGQPVICSGIGGSLDRSLWSVDAFIRDFGDVRNDLINCRTGNIVPNQPMRRFWEGFECVSRRLRDDKGQPMILKLKDWPPGEDFADMMPKRFGDLMSVLPMTDYTRRDGRLNLASCLPDCFVRPDLGPKMYIAYGCALHPSKASTNLHLDISDAVNIMVFVGIPPDGDADNAEALRAIDEAGCDQLTKRRVRDEMPGALWHIYHAADADKIRDLLNKVAIERGDQLEPHHDPIHDQSWYLDGPLRRRLYEEYRVEGYPIVQCAGDAVFIPAGAPHQVRNLHSCIKVAEDFVSPENIGHCFDLTQEFRSLSDTHTNHEDKLQIKNIIYHAMKDAVSCLLGAARPASTAAGAGAGAATGAAAAAGAAGEAAGGAVDAAADASAATATATATVAAPAAASV